MAKNHNREWKIKRKIILCLPIFKDICGKLTFLSGICTVVVFYLNLWYFTSICGISPESVVFNFN